MDHAKLALGSVQFGLDYGISNIKGVTDELEVRDILKLAMSKGIDLIDTAFGYGNSEEVLGKIGISTFKIVTKFLPSTKEISIEDQIKVSFARLKVSQVYGLLAHRPLSLVDNPKIWDYLRKLKEEGIVMKIGFSLNSTEEIDLLIKNGFMPDIIQVPFNYLDRRFIPYMIQFKENGCEVHTRSTFLQGLFFIKPDKLNPFFDEIKPILRELQGDVNLSGRLLGYCIEQPFIDKVIIGVNNKEQFLQNINSIKNYPKILQTDVIVDSKILKPSNWPKS